ncbi:MAG: ABC transporter ATP-binding protein, partial [Candidatus Spechtbacterales bacterium]|nr:ABC transporter ATP-binding protein [Candidatus Spechtbacterales bacterium]
SILNPDKSISILGIIISWGLFWLILWLLVQIFAISSDWILRLRQFKFTTKLQYTYLSDALAHMYRMPVSYHKEKKSGSVMDGVGWAAMWLRNITGRVIIGLAPQFLSIIIGFVFALYINPVASIPLFAGVFIYIFLLTRVNSAAGKLMEKTVRARRRAWGMAHDVKSNIQSVKQFTAEKFATKRVQHAYVKKLGGAEIERDKMWSKMDFSQRFIVITTQLGIFIISVLFILKGEMTIGELIALNGYAAMFFGPFIQLGYEWETLQNGVVTIAETEQNILKHPEEDYIPKNHVKLDNLKGAIEFKNVHFAYKSGEEKLLENISFKIEPGEVVALVGRSGVGKSTLIDLIGRFYLPSKGRVLVDGYNVKKLELEFLRKNTAYVPQEVLLFNDTVLNNLKFANPSATEEEVIQAAKEAKAHNFIKNFPKGYKSKVGERGVKLSVGQKQRIAIARAILRNPKILILDEPTSALDAKTEHELTKSLEKLMEGRTTIIIAHRLSTVRRADKIIVLHEGRVVETGTHDELIKIKNGVYRELYELQKID